MKDLKFVSPEEAKEQTAAVEELQKAVYGMLGFTFGTQHIAWQGDKPSIVVCNPNFPPIRIEFYCSGPNGTLEKSND